jgi:hypothetical protein
LLEGDSGLFVITCPWPGYKELFRSGVQKKNGLQTVIIDPWRLLEPFQFREILHVTRLS